MPGYCFSNGFGHKSQDHLQITYEYAPRPVPNFNYNYLLRINNIQQQQQQQQSVHSWDFPFSSSIVVSLSATSPTFGGGGSSLESSTPPRLSPIPALPPYHVRTLHIHGVPPSEDTTYGPPIASCNCHSNCPALSSFYPKLLSHVLGLVILLIVGVQVVSNSTTSNWSSGHVAVALALEVLF